MKELGKLLVGAAAAQLGLAVVTKVASDYAFKRGKDGKSPSVCNDPETQEIYDRGYKAGQKARRNELAEERNARKR